MTTMDLGTKLRKECPKYDGCRRIGALFNEDFESNDLLFEAIVRTCRACAMRVPAETGEREQDLALTAGSRP